MDEENFEALMFYKGLSQERIEELMSHCEAEVHPYQGFPVDITCPGYVEAHVVLHRIASYHYDKHGPSTLGILMSCSLPVQKWLKPDIEGGTIKSVKVVNSRPRPITIMSVTQNLAMNYVISVVYGEHQLMSLARREDIRRNTLHLRGYDVAIPAMGEMTDEYIDIQSARRITLVYSTCRMLQAIGMRQESLEG